jgi:hypothetical protein
MRILKQSTAIKVPLGPMVDATDGTTLETGITYTGSEVVLIKNDAAAVVNVGGNTFSAHLGGGLYNISLTASDTDTLGLLSIVAADTAHRPARADFMVVPANVYDSIVAGSDYIDVNAHQFNGNATSGLLTSSTLLRSDAVAISGATAPADNLEDAASTIVKGTVQSGSTTTSIKTGLSETQNDHYNGRTIIFVTGTQAKVAATIADYDGASKALTVSALPAAPVNGDTFVIV